MKNFKRLIAGLSLGLLMSTSIASAQSADGINAADILPESIDALYQLNTGPMHPFEDFISEIFSDEFTPEDETEAEAFQVIEDALADNSFTLAMEMVEESEDDYWSMPDMFFTMHISEKDYQHLIDLAQDGEEELQTEQIRGYLVYIVDEDQYFTHVDGLFVMTSSLDSLRGMLESYEDNGPSLGKDSTYINAADHFLGDAFFNMYLDPSMATDMMGDPFLGAAFGMQEFNSELFEAFTGEGISLAQNDEGFDFGIYVEGDQQKLEDLDLLLNKYNFVPKFYKEVSGDGIIFFMEGDNASESILDSKNTLADTSDVMDMYSEFMDWMYEETGLNFEKDVLPALKGRHALAVHSTDQVVPAVTLFVDLEDQRTMAANSMNTLSSVIEEKWENVDGYDYELNFSGTTAFHKHTFDLSVMEDDPLFEAMGSEAATVTLQMGITTDGILIVSTHPHLEKIYRAGKGMTSNASFAEQFSNSEEIAGYMYFNFPALSDYLTMVMTETDASEDMIQSTKDGLMGWHDLYIKSYAEENMSWAYGSLRVDIENMGSFEDFLFGSSYDYDYDYDYAVEESPTPATEAADTGLCDVSSNDWYYSYVTDLVVMGIVQGYEDGCFRPNNEVTRAEFVKMVMEAADHAGIALVDVPTSTPAYFSDVNGEWYAPYVNKAAANDILKGYSDDTFRPNNPITRAEAVQVLYETSNMLQDYLTENPFQDVQSSDWFYNAVGAAYQSGLVSGKSATMFDPNANITRAESAKVVDLFTQL